MTEITIGAPPEGGFQVGDVVEAFGLNGCVSRLTNCLVYVKFLDHYEKDFYQDGKLQSWHKTPSLHFVSRPAPKPKMVEVTRWVAVNRTGAACVRLKECYAKNFFKDVVDTQEVVFTVPADHPWAVEERENRE